MPQYSSFRTVLLFSLCLLSIDCKSQQIKNTEVMTPIFYKFDLDKPVDLGLSPVKIETASGENPIPDAMPDKNSEGYYYRYLNTQKNSRLNNLIPDGDIWHIKWTADLDSNALPWFELLSKDRLLLQNESGWQLFDLSGKFISGGIKSEGDISINESENVFYINGNSGFINAFDLGTGGKIYSVYPYFGKGYIREVYPSGKNKILITGLDLPVMTHNAVERKADFTILETVQLGDIKAIDEDGVLSNANQIEKLICKSIPRLIALSDKEIVFATRDNIYVLNRDLKPVSWFTGTFMPVEMSIDEIANIYLIITTENQNGNPLNELWVINRKGKLLYKQSIPFFEREETGPPVVGYNHNVFIIIKNKIIAFDETGEEIWEQSTLGDYCRVSVLPDNKLLVSEGNLLTLIDYYGKRKIIFNFEGETLMTSPVVSAGGDVFVASKNHLYCLELTH